MAVFWVEAPFSLVEVYQRFRGPCCLHHHNDEIALMMEADYTALQPRRQHSSYTKIIATHSERQTKSINKHCWRTVNLLKVKAGGTHHFP
jgi:hypothetical protein